MQNETFDLLVVGGGCVGSGVAWEAATRGLKVAVVERDDFASGEQARSPFHPASRHNIAETPLNFIQPGCYHPNLGICRHLRPVNEAHPRWHPLPGGRLQEARLRHVQACAGSAQRGACCNVFPCHLHAIASQTCRRKKEVQLFFREVLIALSSFEGRTSDVEQSQTVFLLQKQRGGAYVRRPRLMPFFLPRIIFLIFYFYMFVAAGAYAPSGPFHGAPPPYHHPHLYMVGDPLHVGR